MLTWSVAGRGGLGANQPQCSPTDGDVPTDSCWLPHGYTWVDSMGYTNEVKKHGGWDPVIFTDNPNYFFAHQDCSPQAAALAAPLWHKYTGQDGGYTSDPKRASGIYPYATFVNTAPESDGKDWIAFFDGSCFRAARLDTCKYAVGGVCSDHPGPWLSESIAALKAGVTGICEMAHSDPKAIALDQAAKKVPGGAELIGLRDKLCGLVALASSPPPPSPFPNVPLVQMTAISMFPQARPPGTPPAPPYPPGSTSRWNVDTGTWWIFFPTNATTFSGLGDASGLGVVPTPDLIWPGIEMSPPPNTNLGKTIKTPFYKKGWFWVFTLASVAGIGGTYFIIRHRHRRLRAA